MFSWLRDKNTTTTTTGYNPIQGGESPSITSDSRSRTTSAVSHQQQYSNGRQFVFNDLDRSIVFRLKIRAKRKKNRTHYIYP
jgi:hypothetical protein